MATKMIAGRQRRTALVLEAATTHKDVIVQGIGEVSRDVLGPGHEISPQIAPVMEWASSLLKTSTEMLANDDQSVVVKRDAKAPSRAQRHNAKRALNRELISVRHTVRSRFDAELVDAIGLGAALPGNPVALATRAREVIAAVKANPDAAARVGGPLTLSKVAELLPTLATDLETSLVGQVNSQASGAVAHSQRNKREARWSAVYQGAVALLEALLRLADQRPLAKRVRPAGRGKPRAKSVDDPPAPIPTPPIK